LQPAPEPAAAVYRDSMSPSALPDYASVQDYLFSLKARGGSYGIDRMRHFVDVLGHPERVVPVIHVAGTNGKGSVCAMLEAMLRAAGWRTGLYTSPHLVRLGERVQVDRRPLSEAEISGYVAELVPLAERAAATAEAAHPTFFEFMTAMAFRHFARERCDVAIIEVGLGGRLDATNVVNPEVAIITSIGLDHCEYLGDRLEQIAAEKAGIIKPGRPVVLGRMPESAEQVIRSIAAERQAPVHSVRETYAALEDCPVTNLVGENQRWNAATAELAARVLPGRWRLDEETGRRELGRIDWPGRWQVMYAGGRKLILDAVHNPEAAPGLAQNLSRLVQEEGRRPIVVMGVLGASRARELVPVAAKFAREIVFVVPRQARACGFAELESFVPAAYDGRLIRGTVESLFPGPDGCRVGETGDTVVVAGSIYLLGEILARLEPNRGPDEGRLQDF